MQHVWSSSSMCICMCAGVLEQQTEITDVCVISGCPKVVQGMHVIWHGASLVLGRAGAAIMNALTYFLSSFLYL